MARLIIGANELLPGTQVITENGVTITPKDGLEVLLAIDNVIPASVTLDSGTSLSQKVHVMNKSGNACTLIYTSQNGTSSIALNTNQAASLVWTGDHWNATFSGLITGTDADGNSINYDTDITLDVAPRSRDDYSTSEIFTGQYWIDGKKIYRKSYSIPAFSHTNGTLYEYTLETRTDIDVITNVFGGITTSGEDIWIIPSTVPNGSGNFSVLLGADYNKTSGIMRFYTGGSGYVANSGYVTYEYTKTTN